VTKLKSDRSHVERDEKDSDSNVDEECYRIFQEYKPDPTKEPEEKKRKSEDLQPSSEDIIPVKKQRIAHVASSETLPSYHHQPAQLNPGMLMIERFKKLVVVDVDIDIIDTIRRTTHRPSTL